MFSFFFFFMMRRPTTSTRTATLFPSTTLFRSSSSPLSSWPCPCRTSTWSSFRFSIDARQQRVAQGVAAVLVQCGVVGFADAEHVLGALAEGGDARVVHAPAEIGRAHV